MRLIGEKKIVCQINSFY